MLATGGCLCGAVRYGLTAPAQRVTVCHCRFCQRATGTAYMVEPIFALSDLVVTDGAPRVYLHVSAGSGQAVHIHLCPVCGTKLWLTFDRWPGTMGLYAGTLDDPAWIVIDPAAAKHIFTGVARPDTILPPGVPLFHEHAATVAGVPCTPEVLEAPAAAAGLWR